MPSPKRLDKYPLEYFQLFHRVRSDGLAVIACPTVRAASNLRDRLYAFRGVLLKEAVSMPELRELADAARHFKLGLVKKTVTLRQKAAGDPLVTKALKKPH